MDPLNFRLKDYDQIPEVSESQVSAWRSDRKIVLIYNLVIDYTNFDHPGYNRLIDQFAKTQISTHYVNQHHSFNADIIVCHSTIAKLKNSSNCKEGRTFYQGIKNSEKILKHQAVLEKINFSNPLMSQLSTLNGEELTILTEIPKIFQKPQTIKFKRTWLESIVFEQNFWLNICILTLYVLTLSKWIFSNYSINDIAYNFGFLLFGIVKWTILQYYFHRFQFHRALNGFKDFRGHYIHHSFPNMKNKVAMSIIQTSIQFILIALAYSLFLEYLQIAMIFIGFLLIIIMYQSIHYYCHFGPETNIKWLKYMRIYHLKHHFRDKDRYFGVTTPFWDIIFGTGLDPKLKK